MDKVYFNRLVELGFTHEEVFEILGNINTTPIPIWLVVIISVVATALIVAEVMK